MTPRRVILAPNAFKGSFDAVEVARAWADALRGRPGVAPEPYPLSDGGDGLLAVLLAAGDGLLEARVRVRDPLGRPVSARWAWDPDGDAAVLESAEAVGLARLAEGEADPLSATSWGLGQLLLAAAGVGARRIVVGLGGSATVDGGLGMGRALGYRWEDADGRPVERPGDLADLARIVPPPADPLAEIEVVALADVDAPLLGLDGAAPVFGPQKGAGPEAVERLAAGLGRAAGRWVADLGAPADVADRAGAGAAGGLGGALVALAGATLEPGTSWVAARTGLEAALPGAALVVTGEGRFDAQSAGGKATGWALAAARRAGARRAVVAGAVEPDAAPDEGVVALDAAALGREPGARLSLEDLGALAREAVDRALGDDGPREGGPGGAG